MTGFGSALRLEPLHEGPISSSRARAFLKQKMIAPAGLDPGSVEVADGAGLDLPRGQEVGHKGHAQPGLGHFQRQHIMRALQPWSRLDFAQPQTRGRAEVEPVLPELALFHVGGDQAPAGGLGRGQVAWPERPPASHQ